MSANTNQTFQGASNSALFLSPLTSADAISAAIESARDFAAQKAPLVGASEAMRYRLVKGSKSRTRPEFEICSAIFRECTTRTTGGIWSQDKKTGKQELGNHLNRVQTDQAPHYAPDCKNAGAYTLVSYRDWSNEYRIRTAVDLTQKPQAPENAGDRVTDMLTVRGARKIAESCEYMHKTKGGFSTFVTLTLDDEARARVESGEGTIQKEVSRFFNSLQKMYQRGFEGETESGEYYKHPSAEDKLDYLWVAESPDTIDTETGEAKENPHVHVLMRYSVPFKAFPIWAARVESLWGQGFAHLEKIKDTSKAGAYMAKAAGYLCKAQGKSDQGTIKGNRYNISKTARAPDWVCIGRYELGRMGFLLSEASEVYEEKHGHVKKKREYLKKALDKTDDRARRQKIGKALEGVRQKLEKMPRLSKYQAIFKGEKQFSQFWKWAATNEPVKQHAWLPDKEKETGFAAGKARSHWLHEFTRQRALRKDGRKWGTWLDKELVSSWLDCTVRDVREGVFNYVQEQEDFLTEYNAAIAGGYL